MAHSTASQFFASTSPSSPSYTAFQYDVFPDPFCDIASMLMPTTMPEALRWAERIITANGTYREALRRVLSYFITDIDVVSSDVGRQEKEQYLSFLHDELGIIDVLHSVGMDYLIYGNSFTSLMVPFRRYLVCPNRRCQLNVPFRRVYSNPAFQFKWEDYKFLAKCPRCHTSGEWIRIDHRSDGRDKLRIKRWSPHQINIVWDEPTDERLFFWRIPADYARQIRQGEPLFVLERAHWTTITAVKDRGMIRFKDDFIYHMRMDGPAGLSLAGWGLPPTIVNFRSAVNMQMLHRHNESIIMDYVIPFRVLTPEPRTGADVAAAGPLEGMNAGNFVTRLSYMLQRRRRDPASWNVLPWPIRYQALGGDASQILPSEMLASATEELLNAVGVPAELYRGTLSVQAAPAALRLFESTWSSLIGALNGLLDYITERASKIKGWSPVKCRLMRVTHADDLNRQMAKLNLMAQRDVSRSSVLRTLGMDFEEEQTRMLEEERFIAEKSQELSEEMSKEEQQRILAQRSGAAAALAAAASGEGGEAGPAGQAAAGPTMAAGPMPGVGPGIGPSPSGPVSLEELVANAQQIAQQLMGMPETQRKSQLIQLKRGNPTLHAMVKSELENIRQQLRSQGAEQLKAQMFGP